MLQLPGNLFADNELLSAVLYPSFHYDDHFCKTKQKNKIVFHARIAQLVWKHSITVGILSILKLIFSSFILGLTLVIFVQVAKYINHICRVK